MTALEDVTLIHQIPGYWAAQDPDGIAIEYEGRAFTWAQWQVRIQRTAGALRAAGVGRGDRVATLDLNHLSCFELTLAAASIGAANVVVNFRLAADEVRYILTDSSPVLLLAGEQFVPMIEAMRGDLPSVRRVVVLGGEDDEFEAWIASAAPVDADPAVRPGDTALVLYTSGTTGFPKGALLTHRGLMAHTRVMHEAFGMGAGHRSLVAMPLFHVGGSAYGLVGFYAGVPSLLTREATGPVLLGAIMGGCTHAFLVPAVIAGVVAAGSDALAVLGKLTVLAYGASPAPLPVLRAAMAAMPSTQFLQVYGMTEFSGVVTTLDDAAHHDAGHVERLASAGTLLPGVELRVVDPATLEDVPAGDPGELWFRTEQMMAGYLGKPEATAETITAEGWLRTGDVGRVDGGGFIFIEDRVKDMIITGGENVYGPEVERVIVEHPAVGEVAVVGVPDDRWGEAVLAIVTPADGASIDADELIAYSRTKLAAYKCPREVVVIDALPRNGTGKVLKHQLRAPYWEGRDRAI